MDTEFKQNDVKELTTTLYGLKGLSHELAQEKDSIMSSAGQISFASSQFKQHSIKFEEQVEQLNKKIQMIISQEIKSVGKVISEEASRSFVDNCNSQAESALKKLTDMTNNCEDRLNEATKKIDFFSKWFMSVAVGSAIVGGLFVGGIFRYLPPPTLDPVTLSKIEAGEILEAAWPKLDSKEKQKLHEITKSLKLKK